MQDDTPQRRALTDADRQRAVDALCQAFADDRIQVEDFERRMRNATFDARLAWDSGNWEISLVGQNLAREDQPEFGDLAIPRGLYGTVSWRP